MQHIEFVHSDHFETNYHRHHVTGPLALFIEFFWQTKFDHLWQKYPDGFSDVLFPNLGYSYLINLGSPYDMQIEQNRQQMRGDGFLPRLNNIEAFHRPGNSVFGIKFKVSPVIFEKKVNFSEYSGTMFPLSYLMDQQLINNIKHAGSFEKRVQLLTNHYEDTVEQYRGSLQPINIITEILQKAVINNNFNTTIEDLAAHYSISTRTLQRYFESGTGVSSKQALQVLRIRKAVSHIVSRPQTFHYGVYGYYDYSHFHKHLRQFLQKDSLVHLQPHLQLLQIARKKELR